MLHYRLLTLPLATLFSGTTVTLAFTYPLSIRTPSTSSITQHGAVSSGKESLAFTKDDDHDIENDKTMGSIGRRSFHRNLVAASNIALFANIANPLPSYAVDSPAPASSDLSLYTDKNCGFQLKVPASWEKTEQELQDRRTIVFFIDPKSGEKDKNLIFIAYTPVRDDFTSLSSFGTVDQVAQQTILPKSDMVGEKTDNQMLASDSKKDAYFFDYISQTPGQPKRHFRTIFALKVGATGGAGSVLVTITAQSLEDNYADLKPLFNSVINSYEKFNG